MERGSGRGTTSRDEPVGADGRKDVDRAIKRGVRPPATSPTNLARKDLREQCEFTGGSGRCDRGQKDKKRNGFREVNQNLPSCRQFHEPLVGTAHLLASLITKIMTICAHKPSEGLLRRLAEPEYGRSPSAGFVPRFSPALHRPGEGGRPVFPLPTGRETRATSRARGTPRPAWSAPRRSGRQSPGCG